MVTIGATTEDPEKSALVANTLIEVFFQAYGELQSNTAGRATDEFCRRSSRVARRLTPPSARSRNTAEHDPRCAGKLISTTSWSSSSFDRPRPHH